MTSAVKKRKYVRGTQWPDCLRERSHERYQDERASGTINHGEVVLDTPAELPEGTRVEVLPVEAARPTLGMREEDWPTTPEGIAALLKRMDEVEPGGWLSPEEEAAWLADLREQKEEEKARFFADAEKLPRMWE